MTDSNSIHVTRTKLTTGDVGLIRANWMRTTFLVQPYHPEKGALGDVVEGRPMLGRPFTPPDETRNFWKHARVTGRMVVGVPVPPDAPGALHSLMRYAGYLRGYRIAGRHSLAMSSEYPTAYEVDTLALMADLVRYVDRQADRDEVSAGLLKELKRVTLSPFDLKCKTLANRHDTARALVGWHGGSREQDGPDFSAERYTF